MKSCRIHITGASGSGVTSLGRALADSLAMPHHDTDDYFWRPTIPPYRETREADERLKLMRKIFLPRADWMLSGSLNGWGNPLIPDFDLVVFLVTRATSAYSACAPVRPRVSVPRLRLRADGGTRRSRNSSNGRQ
ncbi:MAG: hypothetical protein ACRED3_01645, partial [Bradyrhizobium sp.]